MKTILVPTDFSPEARKAFSYALHMASTAQAEVVLFHAFHQPIPVSSAYRLDETISMLEKEKREQLILWAADAEEDQYKDFYWEFNAKQGAGAEKQATLTSGTSGFHTIQMPPAPDKSVRITCVSKFGLAADEINQAALTYQADLVLISSRGADAVEQALLGSTVAAVISYCQVPVLTLPQQTEFKQLRSFVFAADLQHLADNEALTYLQTLVKAFQANLHVVHFYQEKTLLPAQIQGMKGISALDNRLSDVSYRVYFRQRTDIVAGIYEFVQQQQADLLVLVPQPHTFLEVLLSRSVTGKITEQGFIPFLTLPDPTRLAADKPASGSMLG
ncbi:universal stress protein [Pontibacter liquoris]|uniref:universal stress protein n=1 Tax=Pontibacter liquoris TaxID=2905677 RepID=UPI001FA76933|nr:universal stress protein [Pontibacter liquoris]